MKLKLFLEIKIWGCRKAVEGALDWFFEEEEMGIILEDDIVPDVSFFDYATKLLDEYRNGRYYFFPLMAVILVTKVVLILTGLQDTLTCGVGRLGENLMNWLKKIGMRLILKLISLTGLAY